MTVFQSWRHTNKYFISQEVVKYKIVIAWQELYLIVVEQLIIFFNEVFVYVNIIRKLLGG